jgi:hypothetical protein
MAALWLGGETDQGFDSLDIHRKALDANPRPENENRIEYLVRLAFSEGLFCKCPNNVALQFLYYPEHSDHINISRAQCNQQPHAKVVVHTHMRKQTH